MQPLTGVTPRVDQTAELEKAFIAEYLERRGHTRQSVQLLPDVERHDILREASLYASARLSEVESRAHYVDELKQK